MEVWTLETDSDFTTLYFPLKEDRAFFHELIEKYFEEFKSVSDKWHPLLMLRNQPMKHPDFFSIDETDVIAVSQKAADSLRDFLKDVCELLPIETDAGRYYAINVLNFVDCLNRKESKYELTKGGIIVKYSLLEFDKEKLGENKIFKIPELPYQVFITGGIRKVYEMFDLKGLSFDVELNLVWYPE